MEIKKISKVAWAVVIAAVALYFGLPEAWYQYKTHGIDRDNLGHDDFLTLVDYGRDKDIEPLIAHLQFMEPGPAEAGKKRIYACIYIHCVDALRAITGVDHGMSADRWAQWFQQKYGRAVEIEKVTGKHQ